jgi:EAL domain-containing protein (putative c-di-GMP-specific phosphodiesterase class I)
MSWPVNIKVAVNLSSVQFRDRHLVETVKDALELTRLPVRQLELEITETVLLHESEATLATLHQLRALGVRISMDDFGTGYSSMSYLRSFPFDKIRIDQSFVRDLPDNLESIAIVRAVIGLGTSLGMTILAEGVETEEQAALLTREVCTELQGYLFSEPRRAADISDLLERLGRPQEVPEPVPDF